MLVLQGKQYSRVGQAVLLWQDKHIFSEGGAVVRYTSLKGPDCPL